MRQIQGAAAVMLFAAAVLGTTGIAHGGTPVSDVDIILEKITGCLIVDPSGGDGLDEVCVSLPKKATPTGIRQVTRADAGWRLDTSTKGQVCARRVSPIGPQPVIFDLEEAPKPGKYSVIIRGGGKVLFRRQGIRSRDLPPVRTITDVSTVLDVPQVLTAGELALAGVVAPDAVPAGGSWSFSGGISGVVLAPEVAGDDPGRNDDGVAANVGGSGSLTGYVLDRQDFDAVASAIEDETRLVLYVPPSFGTGGKGGDPRVLGDPVPDVDITDEQGGSGGGGGSGGSGGGTGSTDPCIIKPGDAADADLLSIWELLCPDIKKPAGELKEKGRAQRDKTAKKKLEATDGQPPEPIVVPIRVTYTNKYGQVLVDGEIEISALEEDGAAWIEGEDGRGTSPPAITFGTEMAFAGQPACVCGRFPRPRHWQSLLLDGERLSPISASGSMVSFNLPAGATPGARTVSGGTDAGFTEQDRWDVTALQLEGTLDRNQLFGGGSTTMRLNIVGTAEPLDVRLHNATPNVITLEGGDDQVATTEGGEPNIVDRRVQATGRGNFNIEWTLDVEPCPCAARLGSHQLSRGIIRKVD